MPAAALPIVSGVLGLGGLAMQQDANRRNQNAQNRAMSAQDAIAARQAALFDAIQARYQQMKAAGAFDPSRRLNLLDRQTAQYESRDAGNLAGALRVAGYKPGDTEIATRLDAIKAKYQLDREAQADRIRQAALNDEMAAMQGQQSAAGLLSLPASIYGGQAAHYGSQYQDLMPAVQALGGSLSQFFKPQGANAVTGGVDAAKVGAGFNLPAPVVPTYQAPKPRKRRSLLFGD